MNELTTFIILLAQAFLLIKFINMAKLFLLTFVLAVTLGYIVLELFVRIRRLMLANPFVIRAIHRNIVVNAFPFIRFATSFNFSCIYCYNSLMVFS